MPTYDYECDQCGYEFEEFHSMSDPAIKDCPECGAKNKVRRLIGCGAGIIFKGSGFYETDYKRKTSPERFSESKAASDSKTNGSASKNNGKDNSKNKSKDSKKTTA